MKKVDLIILFAFAFTFFCHNAHAQLTQQSIKYAKADTLRGSLSKERTWWNVLHYTIAVEPNFEQKTIKGKVDMRFAVLENGTTMQIDLQEPMKITKVALGDVPLTYTRDGNAFFISFDKALQKNNTATLSIYYEGKVKQAIQPPWDGGWIFSKDKLGRPWMSVACQGLGASVWYPCKDHQSDEPDQGATITISVPDSLVAVANGKLIQEQITKPGIKSYTWNVVNPINNYNIVPYIGKYIEIRETYKGDKGNLDCNYWVIDYNLEKAKKQFTQVADMFKAFEHWFGPYPFYEDGYKLVESPHIGMEHQSAIAYGNGFKNGYLGRDLSGSGWGKKWDFIIIHESGHEWFGNNITTNDIADMWVHEGFTNYSEVLFTDYYYGKSAGDAYVQGLRKNIKNESTIIGKYGVNEEGSGDMYFKGANLIHYIRQLMNDDDKFRKALTLMNKTFYHKTTTSTEVELFWTIQTGMDLTALFEQYLRTTQIPTFEVKRSRTSGRIMYRWKDCIPSYNLPVGVFIDGKKSLIKPRVDWQTIKETSDANNIKPDPNFYVGFSGSL
jgi:aminopeptidase N